MQISRSEKIIVGIIVTVGSALILYFAKLIKDTLDTGLTIPRGGVVAFDRADGCPDGWSDFTEGQGRTIVGSGDKYDYRSKGGAATVTLTEAQMPAHSHDVAAITNWDTNIDQWGHTVKGNGDRARLDVDDGPPWGNLFGKVSALAKKQKAEEHENLPPYIALHLCRKD